MRRLILKYNSPRNHLISKKVAIPSVHKDKGIYAWARPYNNLNIEDVDTKLSGRFRYSPIFKNCIAETMVELTGYRSKDYQIAEKQTGKKHEGGVTVWHHAWNEVNGKYLMQLVSFDEHKKTCPHAGGCKLWLSNNGYATYKHMNSRKKNGNYSDIDEQQFYEVENSEIDYYQNGYVSKELTAFIKKGKLNLFGVDMYGNFLYKNKKGVFFWDHESNVIHRIETNKAYCSFYNKKSVPK